MIHTDFSQSTEELLAILKAFPEKKFNSKPSEDRWSAGEIAEHLIKVEIGSVRFFEDNTRPAQRDPEKKIEPLKSTFLDFDKKLTATGPIVPSDSPKDKAKAIKKIQEIHTRLSDYIDSTDLAEIITSYDHPLYGPLTLIEWLYFHIFHSRRHRKQIKELLHQFKNK